TSFPGIAFRSDDGERIDDAVRQVEIGGAVVIDRLTIQRPDYRDRLTLNVQPSRWMEPTIAIVHDLTISVASIRQYVLAGEANCRVAQTLEKPTAVGLVIRIDRDELAGTASGPALA